MSDSSGDGLSLVLCFPHRGRTIGGYNKEKNLLDTLEQDGKQRAPGMVNLTHENSGFTVFFWGGCSLGCAVGYRGILTHIFLGLKAPTRCGTCIEP